MKEQSYFAWLCEMVGVEQPDQSYWLLFGVLHKKEFTPLIPNDDNRAFDGLALREEFEDEVKMHLPPDFNKKGCTFLELLIGLARRCESFVGDHDVKEWFWILLSNVKLEIFTDEDFYEEHETYEIDDILNRINNRTYLKSGRGGLFPLKNYEKDQRKTELWYQLSYYLMENYYLP